MKYATIYKKDNSIIIHPESQTIMGVLLAQAPYIKISVDDTPEKLITSLFECLEASKENIPHPEKWSGDFFLKSIGIKTNKALHKNSLCCSVLMSKGLLEFTPTVNMGAIDGFEEKQDEKIVIGATETKEIIYEYLEKAFELCK